MPDLNELGAQFAAQLARSVEMGKERDRHLLKSEKVHVTGAGGTLTVVYEQLRNAAEYTEEHLLLQRAIRRFYRRLFLARDTAQVASSGEELVVELTLAGYLKNDTVPVSVSREISALAKEYYDAITILKVSGKQAERWILEVLAVEVEGRLNDHSAQSAFVQFAHRHFVTSLDQNRLFGRSWPDFEVGVFVAIHRALLHSDEATIRAMLLNRYGLTPGANPSLYAGTNQKIDDLLKGGELEKLFRAVNRQGAPFRVLWRMVEDQPSVPELVLSRDRFIRAYETQINHEYERIGKRINKGIIKSVIFLIITKFLVGLAIEIPYDYLVHSGIIWLPLIINLAFPPLYMLLLRASLMIPGQANATSMVSLMERYLYGQPESIAMRRNTRSFGAAYNVAYAIFFLLVFGGVSWLLMSLGFSLLHLFIFFLFLSTASFLGFRLSGMIRELEVVDSHQSGVTVVRDFLYMPFVVVGRWVSEKYSRLNLVANALDLVIELPLKTVLRLVRQWSAFISSKKDEL